MSDLDFEFKHPDKVLISHAPSGVEWAFYVEKDRSGRRRLDGPHGTAEAMADGNLLQQACTVARSEAMRAGKVDY